ncbi:hypothetical protein EPA93_40285 [Ktedonosporobacter rubrisoli]|uniref:Uncharacterized protein n=1 Tax=Ktedonosporobacter rubrisoli TaxID=2509675 RepID=A0A4P6K1K3_KTERU|nr:hypothetical protein [Ktedonosporobacter rubrisoli]QBD81885.1 hypothetical protein EPA93_40285 [Ktedonosporobacter rubrisoli]
MSQPDTKKRSLISFISSLSPRNKTILGILIILVVTVLAVLYAPPEGESNNVTGDLPYTPTVTINNLVETVNINRSFTYGDVHITVTKAMLATKYSDDRRRGGVYTVRVMAQAENKGAQPVGVDYISLTRLVLPDGQEIAPSVSHCRRRPCQEAQKVALSIFRSHHKFPYRR